LGAKLSGFEHSLSPSIHTLFAQQTGVQIEYDKILTPVDAFVATAQNFINQGGIGLVFICLLSCVSILVTFCSSGFGFDVGFS
jgi:hypothetical protein